MMKKITNHKRQRGAVLVISLIMLLVMTLIGITGMQATVLEEKMAGNYNDQNIAFQAAESTLIEAEEYASSGVNYGDNGVYDVADTEPGDYFDPTLWAGTGSSVTLAVFGNTFGIRDNPRYVIAQLNPGNLTYFRITVRAVGKAPGTQVILQEIYCVDSNGAAAPNC